MTETKRDQKENFIGLNVRDAKQRLDELRIMRSKLIDERANYMPNQYGDTPLKFIELSQKINAVNDEMHLVREWYNVGISESLYHESKRLNTLTIALIALTAILGILTVVDILLRLI